MRTKPVFTPGARVKFAVKRDGAVTSRRGVVLGIVETSRGPWIRIDAGAEGEFKIRPVNVSR